MNYIEFYVFPQHFGLQFVQQLRHVSKLIQSKISNLIYLKHEIIMVGTQMQDMGKDYMYC